MLLISFKIGYYLGFILWDDGRFFGFSRYLLNHLLNR